jgi:hypothetical protein
MYDAVAIMAQRDQILVRAIATFAIFVRGAWQGERTCCASAVD